MDTLPITKELLKKTVYSPDTISMEMIVSWSVLEKTKGLAGRPGKIKRLPWIATLKIFIEVIVFLYINYEENDLN